MTLLVAAHFLIMTCYRFDAGTSGADVTAGLECTGLTGGGAGHGCQVHSAHLIKLTPKGVVFSFLFLFYTLLSPLGASQL